MKWMFRLAMGMAMLLALAAASAWVYVHWTLPQLGGTLTLAGPRAEIRIERDGFGIPTIKAGSIDDAMFGLGFVHGQDRLWQLEMHRRIGSGQLAEVFGESALNKDKFLRALGVKRAAAVQWANLSPQARDTIAAYAAGVNAYISEAMEARPPEFIALGIHPEPWTTEDSLAWLIMMAWDVGSNWTSEMLRMRLALKMPVGRVNELIPPYPGDAPLVGTDYAALFRDLNLDGTLGQEAMNDAPESGVEGMGSNGWVLGGAHTDNGHPLLANDPHLKLSVPGLWYLARIEAPGLKVAGASMPGLPWVVLGQNADIAWGFTNTGADVQDLYLERIKPDDPTRYQTPKGWAPFDTFSERIKVKGKSDVTIVVRATRHGPVISDVERVADDVMGPKSKPAYALAMRWTALDPDAGSVDVGLALNRATSVADFIAMSARYVAPMQNMVVADRAGHIGMVAAGRVPLRKPQNDLRGQVPSPGWDARYDWAGSLDASLTPREIDPTRGWIATANQRIHPVDYPYYITNEWAAPYRMQRIEQMIDAKPKHDLDSLREMQADVVSLATQRLLPFLQRAKAAHAQAAAAHAELANFDGTMVADRAAPLIFWSWVRHLTHAVFADEMGEELWVRSGRSFRDALEGVLERNDGWWCDDKTTPALETCDQQIDIAFRRALEELQKTYGADVAAWQWGRAHVARAEHRPFSQVKALAKWFELRSPVGGDTYTVNASRVSLEPDVATGELYLNEHGPSLRALYDLGDLSKSRFMHSSGQSGIVFSPLYRNFLEPWAHVDYVPLWGGTVEHTLVLSPTD